MSYSTVRISFLILLLSVLCCGQAVLRTDKDGFYIIPDTINRQGNVVGFATKYKSGDVLHVSYFFGNCKNKTYMLIASMHQTSTETVYSSPKDPEKVLALYNSPMRFILDYVCKERPLTKFDS